MRHKEDQTQEFLRNSKISQELKDELSDQPRAEEPIQNATNDLKEHSESPIRHIQPTQSPFNIDE